MSGQPYTWNAQDYAQHSSAQLAWAKELIGKLCLSGNETILDIGSGDGKVTALLAQAAPGGHTYGIDRSFDMVQLARNQFPQNEYANLTFAQMDAAHLCFSQGFDIAFSNATLHWVKDHLAVLECTTRALRQGGRFLFQMGGRGNAAEVVAAFDQVIKNRQWSGCFKNFTFPYTFLGPDDYYALLERAGLLAQYVELIPKDMQYPRKTDLTGWVRTTWLPYIERVPDRLHHVFLEEVIDTYLKACPPDEQGIVHVKMVRLEVGGVKKG